MVRFLMIYFFISLFYFSFLTIQNSHNINKNNLSGQQSQETVTLKEFFVI